MASIVLNGDTSGSVTLSPPAVAGTNTATLPAATGTVMVSGNMPAFRAVKSSSQTGISNTTFTKCTYQTETFDTNNNFASSTFTPTVAGYYQVNGTIDFGNPTIANAFACIYKNGSLYTQGGGFGTGSAGEYIGMVSDVVYCNGSTDYIEIYGYMSSSGTNIFYGGAGTVFSAVLVRGA